jgi:hypothetical protein
MIYLISFGSYISWVPCHCDVSSDCRWYRYHLLCTYNLVQNSLFAWTTETFLVIFAYSLLEYTADQMCFPKLQLSTWTTDCTATVSIFSAMTYYRYYLEPSVVKNNGSVGFSPPGTQTHSRTSTPTHAASVTTTVTTPTSDIKPLSSLLGSQTKSLKLNVQVSSCHNKLACCTWYILVCMLDMLHCDHMCRLSRN